MYNGIGLETVRGSGTNGFVQRNMSFIRRHKDNVDYKSEEELKKLDSQINKGPNQEILEHERKRKVELKCMEMQELMEEQGYSNDEIDRKVSVYRQMLMEQLQTTKTGAVETDEAGRPIAKATHQLAEANQVRNDQLKSAFGLSEFYKEGSSFDPERKAKEQAAEALALAKKKYAMVPDEESSSSDDSSDDNSSSSSSSASPRPTPEKKKKKKPAPRSRSVDKTTSKRESSRSPIIEKKRRQQSKSPSPVRKSRKQILQSSSSPVATRKHTKVVSPVVEERHGRRQHNSPRSRRKGSRKSKSPSPEERKQKRISSSPSPLVEKHEREAQRSGDRCRKRPSSPTEKIRRKISRSLPIPPVAKKSRRQHASSDSDSEVGGRSRSPSPPVVVEKRKTARSSAEKSRGSRKTRR